MSSLCLGFCDFADKSITIHSLRRLVLEGAIETFYPLHDGFHRNKAEIPPDPPSYRMWLHQNWAAFGNMFKIQPLDQIRNYFGEKVALYFAFMGFYTNWLIGKVLEIRISSKNAHQSYNPQIRLV